MEPRGERSARGVVEQKAVVIIPARLGSTRLPRKVLADIRGKPMLWHVCNRSSQAKSPTRVLVATDSREVSDAVQSWGWEALMTNPACPSGTARIASIADQVEEELVVNVQGDEPLIVPQVIDCVIDALARSEADVATPVYRITEPDDLINPNIVKVARGHDGQALYFSRSPVPFVRDVAPAEWLSRAAFWGHIGVYAYRRELLNDYDRIPEGLLEQAEKLEQLRFLEAGYCIQTVEVEYRPLAVDIAADLERVRILTSDESL